MGDLDEVYLGSRTNNSWLIWTFNIRKSYFVSIKEK